MTEESLIDNIIRIRKQRSQAIRRKITKDSYTQLKKFYAYIYKCKICQKNYGTDKEIKDKSKYVCPVCDL